MAKAKTAARPYEVVNVISSGELARQTFVRTKPVEIRQRSDGQWSLWYPDPGFNPCNCSKSCISETLAGPKMIESSFRTYELEVALEEAKYMGGVGEPRVLLVETQSERMQRVHAERRQSKEKGL